jgi:hypothetical protein
MFVQIQIRTKFPASNTTKIPAETESLNLVGERELLLILIFPRDDLRC